MVKRVSLPIGVRVDIIDSLEAGEEGNAWYNGQKVKVTAKEAVDAGHTAIVIDEGNNVLPDYAGQLYRSRFHHGYEVETGEIKLWMLRIDNPTDHPSSGISGVNFSGIAAGAEVALIDVFQGTAYHTSPAGWDYVIKEFWVSYNQRMRFLWWQDNFAGGDCACLSYFEAYSKPVNEFVIGWNRSQLEALSDIGKLTIYLKNEGSAIAYGKSWVTGYEKKGTYKWL